MRQYLSLEAPTSISRSGSPTPTWCFSFQIAQLVEQAVVNRLVTGSSPVPGAVAVVQCSMHGAYVLKNSCIASVTLL